MRAEPPRPGRVENAASRVPFSLEITLIKVSMIVSMVAMGREDTLAPSAIYSASGEAEASYRTGRERILAGYPTAAIEQFRASLGSREWRGLALVGLGDSLAQLGMTDEALEEYLRAPAALRRDPGVALRIAACKLALGRVSDAARILRRLVRRDKNNRYAGALLARCYAVLHRYGSAHRLAFGILREQPAHSEALKAACMASSGLGDIENTLTASRRLLEIEPSQTNAAHYLYHLLLSSTPVGQIEAEYARVQERFTPSLPGARRPWVRRTPGPVRVGYLSGLFGSHLDCFLPFFRHHDNARFEIYAFADRAQRYDAAKARLAHHCKEWIEISALSNEQAAATVREAGIDILVDCDGHFQTGRRLGMYNYHPARLQVAFLYPHRTGVSDIDYQIGDHRLFPAPLHRTSERVVYLPLFACHEPPPSTVPVNDLPALRNGFVTFGSFNQPIKINESVIAAWARILRRIPRSRIVLHSKMGPLNGDPYPEVRRRFLRLFAGHGVAADRVTIVANRDLEAHMGMYHGIDLALDPWPHNGMRTTFMALWMGVPVLTKAGDAMVSRMGASLITEAGLPDWVAPDVDAYVDLACRKCENLDALADLRRCLRDKVKQSRLFDGERFARSLEAAFLEMLEEQN